LSIEQYVQGVLQQDRVILSRAILLLEVGLRADKVLPVALSNQIFPTVGGLLGIAFPAGPGGGRGRFIEAFGQHVLQQGHRLAVLTVDPSSQASKGSILGDKTRMSALASDKRAFIRPSPSGNSLGGVAAKTREAMLLCEAAGFDVIFVE